MLALNYLDLPQKLVWAAGGFGGGLYHRDLCGYLTGGIMGIGFACSKLKIERKRAKKILGEAVKKYWAWWKTEAPLRCLEIRKPKSDKNICVRLGYIAAAKVEELIKVIQAQA